MLQRYMYIVDCMLRNSVGYLNALVGCSIANNVKNPTNGEHFRFIIIIDNQRQPIRRASDVAAAAGRVESSSVGGGDRMWHMIYA